MTVIENTVRKPVAVEYKEMMRDSIVYLDSIETQAVEVEKKLTWQQNLKMKADGLVLLIALIGIIYILITHFVKLKSILPRNTILQ